MRGGPAVLAALVALLVAAATAHAHVDVLPATLEQGTAAELTVRVPNERDVPTTRVRVDVPPQVTVYSLGEPPPGWSVTGVRAADGRIGSVIWAGGAIPPGRYADFTMLGTPFDEGVATWPARQTYADGQVKPWTGPPEDEGAARTESGPTDPGPAAQTTIVAVGSAPAAAAAAAGGGDDDSGAAIWLGVIAIGVAALALIGVGFLWSSRPARLPEDEEGGA
ncbi:MAG: DUF1775 domain-containing protein [Thermoleophilia bacterium]